MLTLMFKNITTLAKAHLLHCTGTCRIPMNSDKLNSFTLFSESLLKLLLPGNSEEKFYESIDILQMLAFSNLQLSHYCHKNITSSGILLEVQHDIGVQALKDGVLKPMCDCLTQIIKRRDQYDNEILKLLLAGFKRNICLLKKADTDALDNNELMLVVLSILLVREIESDTVSPHLLAFLLDSQYSKKLIDSRNSLYQAIFTFMKTSQITKDAWPEKL